MKKSVAKVSAMAMAAAMMMSMSVPAFAAVTNNTTSEASSTYFNTDDDYAKADVDDAYSSYNSADKQGDTEVEVVQASTLKITIPKKIVLDGTRNASDGNKASYDVTVNDGNIPGDVVVNIVPKGTAEADGKQTFAMKEAGGKKKDLTATITPGDTTWTITDDGTGDAEAITDATHDGNSVEVANLSAGEWAGTFNFDISITAADSGSAA
jgi:hypothetical protein